MRNTRLIGTAGGSRRTVGAVVVGVLRELEPGGVVVLNVGDDGLGGEDDETECLKQRKGRPPRYPHLNELQED